MNELLFLLLPLAFYSGWKASGKSLKPTSEKRQLSDNFVRGVNYLLNEEPDKALDVFLNRPEIDEYTAETYLLLGNLFRNRGEVDRALSVHQNLIGRASLNREQKTTTMLALGKDFLAAGMMDRAEQVFTELLRGENKTEDAREALRNIYEQTQEWDKAIAVTEASSQTKTSNVLGPLVANYYCELAEESLLTGHIQHVNEMLEKARASYPNSTRVKVITARIHALQQEYQESSALFLSVAQEAPRLLGTIYQPMLESYEKSKKLEQLQDELYHIYMECSDAKVLEYTLRLAIDVGPSETIMQHLPEILESKQLNIRTIRQAVNLYCKNDKLESTDTLHLIQSALSNHLSSQPGFQCRHCGYKMHDFLWRCPACNHWDEVVNV